MQIQVDLFGLKDSHSLWRECLDSNGTSRKNQYPKTLKSKSSNKQPGMTTRLTYGKLKSLGLIFYTYKCCTFYIMSQNKDNHYKI